VRLDHNGANRVAWN